MREEGGGGYVIVTDVSQQLQFPVAALGVDHALEGPRELLDGHLLFRPGVHSRAAGKGHGTSVQTSRGIPHQTVPNAPMPSGLSSW